MSIIFGILAGIGVPIQTSINARLRKKVGSPYRASLVSFAVSLIFLVLLLLILGQGVHIPFDKMLQEPVWIWFGGIPSEEYSIQAIQKAQAVHPLSAIQNIYSMVERSCEEEVIPYCMEHNIALVPFSPIASGLLSGKVNTSTDFSHNDDVRKFVPQLKKENLEANQPLIQLIETYAKAKNATDAQIALAWMLHKYPNVVPIPGSKNQERILENLAAWDVILTDEEFNDLDKALEQLPVQGFRGHVEFQGGTMADWGKRK